LAFSLLFVFRYFGKALSICAGISFSLDIIEGIINGVLTLKYSQIVKLLQQLHSFTDAIHVEFNSRTFYRLSVVKPRNPNWSGNIKEYNVTLLSICIVLFWTVTLFSLSYRLLKNRFVVSYT
jgi:hypothetical protein